MSAVNPSCSEAAMEVKTVKLISEEKEELLKSIKKVKRADGLANETSRKIVSYRDTLGEDFCHFEAYLEKEPVSMEEFDDCLNEPVLENIKDGVISITLSSDEKDRIRLKWDKILIIEFEAFGRTFGYQYLLFKLNQLWNLSGELQLIDLDSAPVTLAYSHPMDMSTFSPSPANVSTVQHPIVEPAVSGTWLMVQRKSRARKPFIEAALKSPTAAATFSADKAGPGSAEPAGSAAVKAAESQKVSRC
ncbi:hypothetical protein Goshw_024032 [Gossypium schwendimanii]|uniref:Uncharacterized protein n=1 Tax=Gossypium schwendimanii TaxID=34291 RepID=A0A7J9MK29_GOSSC|nr:hypothetical protein [Gossypium schwendimanii]